MSFIERIPSVPPIIPALAHRTSRPLWSVMIPVFNCSQFLRDALESVLNQDLGTDQMQIEVVDDASTDADVEQIVREIGKGRVRYFRQAANVGSLRNFETCLNRAQGKLVHLLHGDDRVKKGFYLEINSLVDQYPTAGAFVCNYCYIDQDGKYSHHYPPVSKEEGILQNWFETIAERQCSQYVATVVKREVYEKLGGFYGVTFGEDWEMWVRIAKHYEVAYTPEILAEYREHSNSISSEKASEGKNSDDIIKVCKLIEAHLPEKNKKELIERTKKDCAFFCISMANKIWRTTRNKKMALRQVNLALSQSNHYSVYYHILKLYLKLMVSKY